MGFMKPLAKGGVFGMAGLAASKDKKTSEPFKQRAFGSLAVQPTLSQQAGKRSLLTRGG